LPWLVYDFPNQMLPSLEFRFSPAKIA